MVDSEYVEQLKHNVEEQSQWLHKHPGGESNLIDADLALVQDAARHKDP